MLFAARRRLVGSIALVALSVGVWQANAGSPASQSAVSESLLARLEKLCEHAQAGTYGLPGHYCDSAMTPARLVTDEAVDRIAKEIQRTAVQAAPDGQVPANAMANAIAQKARLRGKGQSSPNGFTWTRNGRGPLQVADAGYTGVNGLGLVEVGGRITDFAYDAKQRRVFASAAGGGLFMSSNYGASWKSIGDRLPTLLIGAVGWTSAGGGTLVVLTGDGSFGRYSLEGAGIYRSTDLGRTWTRAKGAPSDAFGFRVAVDPSNPKVIYAATGSGLFRSTDVGKTFSNVKLPTGPCAGKSNRVKGCTFANVVTDVVVQTPGGVGNVKGGAVVAAVGWRDGQAVNPKDNTIQSPNNGVYTSPTGRSGTFAKSAAPGFTAQDHIGRIEFGATTGTDQDHNYLYALVQNAKATQKGGQPAVPGNPEGINGTLSATYKAAGTLDGVFVSPDFGATWIKQADGLQLQSPTTGSALAVVGPALAGYGAGVQAWYNQFIKPDPTRTAPGGIPTRLLFGLEEVWENDDNGAPQNRPTHFRVIGRYFSGNTCLFLGPLASNTPYLCPTSRQDGISETTTTHPDQHAVLFIPDGEGGVRLLVGNDGGVYTQRTGSAVTDDFQNAEWGIGNNKALDNLQPYNVARAKDGTIWMGLQDNGTAKIADVRDARDRIIHRERQIETLGGDGFFVGVNPNDSNQAYGEYVGGAMSGTVNGGINWSQLSPPITGGLFSTPFSVDSRDPNHVMIGGNEIVESGSGPSTGADDWRQVFDLGTQKRPGDPKATESETDANNIQTAVEVRGDNAYVAYCGVCDVLHESRPFRTGIATNVGGKKAPKRFTSDGWHIAAAKGLPDRYITSLTMDRSDPRVIYATLGSYTRRWTPPGTVSGTADTGGNLYKSVDAGETFVDVSGDLPRAPANWVVQRGDQLVVANDLGVFASSPSSRCGRARGGRCSFEVLGKGMPSVPVLSMQLSPWDCRYLTVASHGRGAWTYDFGSSACKDLGPKPEVIRAKPFSNTLVKKFDFEADAQGWTASTTDSTGVAQWQRTPGGHESAWAFEIGPYTDSVTATLTSSRMTLPQASTIQVSYWKNQFTEPCCDGLAVDWSSDGKRWRTLSSVTDGEFPNYQLAKAPTFKAPAGSLWVRFRLVSDAGISSPPYVGVLVDDVEIRR